MARLPSLLTPNPPHPMNLQNDSLPYSSPAELAELCAVLYKTGVTFYVNPSQSLIVITGF